MTQMATVPVYACRVCGTPVYVTHLSTQGKDEDAEKLKMFMQGLAKIALCPPCQKKRTWYASQGREAEFLANELNPATTIYNVVDNSKLDYYGRNIK